MSSRYDPRDPEEDDLESVACDRCGKPTPRCDPPSEIELCDECYGDDIRRINGEPIEGDEWDGGFARNH